MADAPRGEMARSRPGLVSRLFATIRGHARIVAPAAVALAIVVVLVVNGLSPAEQPGRPFGRVVNTACRVDQPTLIRMSRDYYRGRAGDIAIIPLEPNFVAASDGGITHETPSINLQHVPLFLLAPDYIHRDLVRTRTVTVASIAPTIASLIGFQSRGWLPEEAPLASAIRADRPTRPPKLVLTMVWEGVGRNVLDKWPTSWPNLQRLENNGTWFDKASAGSVPSADAAVQTTMGTAVYPRTHGITGDVFRLGGRLVRAFGRGPSELAVPSLADLYDASRGGRPLVGLIGSDTAGLGLIGHGASFRGGDRDLLALHAEHGRSQGWGLPHAGWARDFQAPPSLRRSAGPSGRFDGPAGVDAETGALEELIRSEGFGRDGTPDLLVATYRMPQAVAERDGLNTPQMQRTVRALDHDLLRIRGFLNKTVGLGNWALILTADHGSTPNPQVVGAFPIDPNRLRTDLQRRFGGGPGHPPVVQGISPTQIWLNLHRLRRRGFSRYDVSRYLLGYTIGDNRGAGVEGADQRVFEAAFPTNLLPLLPCLGS